MKTPVVTLETSGIPDELKTWNQWVVWRYDRRGAGEQARWCKTPISPRNGRPASVKDERTWASCYTAVAYYRQHADRVAGIGFVLSENDPFVGIDLDHCRDSGTGLLTPSTARLLGGIDTYSEASPSGTGVKCIARSTVSFPGRRRSDPDVEMYSADRYFTITGNALGSCATISDRTPELRGLHTRLFQPDSLPFVPTSPVSTKSLVPANSPTPGQRPAPPDEVVLYSAQEAANGKKFQALWKGSTALHRGNASNADMALCRILAFWCGDNPEQIDRLFRRSGRYRNKWNNPHHADGSTYGEWTIRKAIHQQNNTFYRWTGLRKCPA